MKVGILAQYLDSRNDIRDLITNLSKKVGVVVFLLEKDIHLQKFLPGIEMRIIKSAKPKNLRNIFLKYLFMCFGKIPKSRANYFFTEYTKIKHSHVSSRHKIEKKISLFLTKYFPSLITYDRYLKLISYNTSTPIEDIDAFLCFTEVYDNYLFAHALNSNKPVFTYVYSWDHPCKMKTLSKKVNKYLVWNNGLKEDLINLHNISPEKIIVFGASQLTYILEYFQNQENQNPYPNLSYIYFGCAFGHSDLVPAEVEYIEEVAKTLEDVLPDWKLVVRPYPFLSLWQLYEPLLKYKNIIFDNEYRNNGKDFSLDKKRIFEKFDKLYFSKGFIHLGTTMGFEGTYFNVPILHLVFPLPNDKKDIRKYIRQYHNEKYLILKSYPNIVNKKKELVSRLKELKESPEKLLNYNKHVSSLTHLKSMEDLSKVFIEIVKKEIK